MTNTASLLIARCGLSQKEAAAFLSVSIDTVKSWMAGRNRCPDGVIDDLSDLYIRIDEAAQAIMRNVAEMAERDVEEDDRVVSTMTDAEARERGWPCAAPANAAVGIAVALSDHGFTVEPLSRL